jgi:threonine dehydrogenase-like Zn-dependent dehydrogenase
VAIHGLRCNPIAAAQRLAVLGAGTIGLLTALYAGQMGWTITVVHRDGHPPGPALTCAIPARFRSTSAITGDGNYDAVVDAATGTDSAPLELALRLVHDGGTVVVQNAYHPGVTLQAPLRDVFRRSIRLIGSFSYCRRKQPDDFNTALAFLRDHSSRLGHLVHHAGGLADLPAALASGQNRRARRVLAIT